MHETRSLIEFIRRLDAYPDDAMLHRPLAQDLLSAPLHLLDSKLSDRTVREGPLLVPSLLKGQGVTSWLQVGTVRHILQGHDVPNMSDEQVLALFQIKV